MQVCYHPSCRFGDGHRLLLDPLAFNACQPSTETSHHDGIEAQAFTACLGPEECDGLSTDPPVSTPDRGDGQREDGSHVEREPRCGAGFIARDQLVRFGYDFSKQGRVVVVEHLRVLNAGGKKDGGQIVVYAENGSLVYPYDSGSNLFGMDGLESGPPLKELGRVMFMFLSPGWRCEFIWVLLRVGNRLAVELADALHEEIPCLSGLLDAVERLPDDNVFPW